MVSSKELIKIINEHEKILLKRLAMRDKVWFKSTKRVEE